MPKKPILLLLPSLTASTLARGQLRITRKFIEGVEKFRQFWPGSVKVLLEEANHPGDHLDPVDVHHNDLPFLLKITPFNQLPQEAIFRGASVVLGSAGWRQNSVPKWCQHFGIQCVMTTEYSLKTRQQMVHASVTNPIRRFKRHWWERLQEHRQIQAIRLAQGVQCNGTPTFEAYRHLNARPMLFFDSRVSSQSLISKHQLDDRLSDCVRRKRLHLVFSGRLIAIKGADHLLEVADHLHQWGVNFEFTICGDGDFLRPLLSTIHDKGLASRVHLRGTLDFHQELLPLVQERADLFVCCHRQGDPSCTYLETMSCGVPIVGYQNEALAGLVKASKSGWLTPMNQPFKLARQIADLEANRSQIILHSHQALAFASRHTFENTFRRRVKHVQALLS